MSFNAFSTALRRFKFIPKDTPILNFTLKLRDTPSRSTSLPLQFKKCLEARNISPHFIKFSPRTISNGFDLPKRYIPVSNIIESPINRNLQIDDPSNNQNIEKGDLNSNNEISMPTVNNIIEKQAVRMIVIRRKKMKKHRRKKWLKKFKFLLRKIKQRRGIKREKRFQAEMQVMIAEAKAFDAEKHVKERIHLLVREHPPNMWEGEYLPAHVIYKFREELRARIAYKKRLRTYRLKLDDET